MKRVVTLDMARAHVAGGGAPGDLSEGAILTPLARDFLRDNGFGAGARSGPPGPPAGAAPAEPVAPDYEFRWDPAREPRSDAAVRDYFDSPEIAVLKRRMIDIGRRMWERGYTDGNGGNLTIRVGENLVLCTPTMISKGFMREEDMCLVDLEGRQLAGRRKRTSEVLTHLAIIKRQPKAKACCHAHPPYATAFALARVRPPTCLMPEAEVFLGEVGMAEYQTPGTPEVAEAVGAAGYDNMAVLMENHGVITWGKDVEDAYWRMENIDAYCKTVWVASQLGKDLAPFSTEQARDLIELRKTLGMTDKREHWKECELCDNSEFRPGFTSCPVPAPGAPDQGGALNEEAELLVRTITEQILEKSR